MHLFLRMGASLLSIIHRIRCPKNRYRIDDRGNRWCGLFVLDSYKRGDHPCWPFYAILRLSTRCPYCWMIQLRSTFWRGCRRIVLKQVALGREQSGGGECNRGSLCIEWQILKMRRDHVGLGTICCWYCHQGKWQLSSHSVAECIPLVVLVKRSHVSHCAMYHCWHPSTYSIPLTHMGWSIRVLIESFHDIEFSFKTKWLARYFGNDRLLRGDPARVDVVAMSIVCVCFQ